AVHERRLQAPGVVGVADAARGEVAAGVAVVGVRPAGIGERAFVAVVAVPEEGRQVQLVGVRQDGGVGDAGGVAQALLAARVGGGGVVDVGVVDARALHRPGHR